MPRVEAVSAFALVGAALFGCSGASTIAPGDTFLSPPDGARDVTSNTPVERYFPLIDGTIYSYRTTAEDGDVGLLVLRARRVDSTHGELLYKNGRRKRFAYTSGGVAIEPSFNLVLASPVQEGATFRGQNGCPARIDGVGVVIDVKAGSYRDCVRVVELCSGDRKIRYTTTLCPDVGIVVMDAEAGTNFDHAELQSMGPPIDITDGTTVIPVPEVPATPLTP